MTQEGEGGGAGPLAWRRRSCRSNELIGHFPLSDELVSPRSSWTSFFSRPSWVGCEVPDVLVRRSTHDCTLQPRTCMHNTLILLTTSYSHKEKPEFRRKYQPLWSNFWVYIPAHLQLACREICAAPDTAAQRDTEPADKHRCHVSDSCGARKTARASK